MREALDLFSGIGGFALACGKVGIRTRAFCEIDPFCREVLRKHWPEVPIFDDVRSLAAEPFRGIDLICGGFPCQDVSVAGRGTGIDGERSGLWREFHRLIREARPRWVLVENVPALRTRGSDRVLADLEGEGYSCWPLVVGAWAVGAPHRRDRVWIVAHRDAALREQPGRSGGEGGSGEAESRGGREDVAHADGVGRGLIGEPEPAGVEGARGDLPDGRDGSRLVHAEQPGLEGHRPDAGQPPQPEPRHSGPRWPAGPGEPQHDWEQPRLVKFEVGSSADGVSVRLVRLRKRNNRQALKAYGNSVVVDVVESILMAIQREDQWLYPEGISAPLS